MENNLTCKCTNVIMYVLNNTVYDDVENII